MLRRQRDHRDTWNLTLVEKVSGNYYPVTAKIAIEDDSRRFAILTDRAQGGSSLADGSLEVMVCFLSLKKQHKQFFNDFIVFIQVHRRLLHDDAFGVGEALNESAYGKGLIARGSSYFILGPKEHSAKVSTEATERFVQLQTLLPSWLFFSNVSHLTYDAWKNNYKNIVSSLNSNINWLKRKYLFIFLIFHFMFSSQPCHFRSPKTFICSRSSHGKRTLF